MTIYTNPDSKALFSSVELTPLPEGNFTFFHANAQSADALKQWLTSAVVGQEIVGQATVDGNPVLVTHGKKSSDDLLKLCKESGQQLVSPMSESSFNAWKWRGRFSNLGQTLNLISAYRKPGGIDVPKLMFAGLNFSASYINSKFGAQKAQDDYQLLHLKENINRLLAKEIPDKALPDINDNRSELREEEEKPKNSSEKASDFMRANSVVVGEIGLRYLGAIAMAFPMQNWGKAAGAMRKGAFGEAFALAKNKDSTNFYTGITYLTGKTVGLFSKVPDPYNPAPHTWLDTVREQYAFRASSAIEAGAASVLAVGNFRLNKSGQRDYLGAAGGASLVAGLLTRQFAKFGSREVDMPELYAHTTDALAKAPPDKLPQLLAECAASIHEHFKDNKKSEYGEVYFKLMTDLYRYHHIAVDNHGSVPEDRLTQANSAISKPAQSGQTSIQNYHTSPSWAARVAVTTPALGESISCV